MTSVCLLHTKFQFVIYSVFRGHQAMASPSAIILWR